MTSRKFNFYINSLERTNGTTRNNANYFIDWSASMPPRTKYKCSFVFNSITTNNIIGPDNGDIYPAILHINLGCNSNFSFQNGLISNTNTIGMLKWETINDATGKGYSYSDITSNVPFFFNNL